MGSECHWVWKNGCFSHRRFTRSVAPCLPEPEYFPAKPFEYRDSCLFVDRLCDLCVLLRPLSLVAALPLWVIRGQNFRRDVQLPLKVLAACANFPERSFSSSPRDGGVGRGPRGVSCRTAFICGLLLTKA